MILNKNTTIFIILVFIYCLTYSQVSFLIDTREVKVGDIIHMTTKLSEDQSLNVSKDQQLEKLAIMNEKRIKDRFVLDLLPLSEGKYSIPPIKFDLVEKGDTKEIFSSTFEVNLVSRVEPAEGTEETQLRPDVPFKSLKDKWNPVFLGMIAFIVMIILLILAYFINKKGKQMVFGKQKEPAHVIAYRQLEELGLKNYLENNKDKAFCVELSFIMKSYIKNRFNMDIVEMTTDEISRFFSESRVVLPEKSKILDYFRKMDLVKFARYHLRNEMLIEIFDFTKGFVKKTEEKNDEIA